MDKNEQYDHVYDWEGSARWVIASVQRRLAIDERRVVASYAP